MKTTLQKYRHQPVVPILYGSVDSKPYVLTLHDMADDQKPREKLLRDGPTILSSAELLAVMLTTGTKKEDIMNMCSRILREYGEKSIASERDPKRMARELGIPVIKSTQIVAAVEMGRRLFEQNASGRRMVRTARDVYDYVKNMRDLPREHLRGIYLDSRYKVIRDETLSIGTANAHIIHPRDVFKPAIEYGAVAVIIVHNHPSGSLKPSRADYDVTEQLSTVGTVLGIPLIDHIIVSSKGFASVMHVTNSKH